MRKEKNQNLGKTLPLNETKMSKAQFIEFLKNSTQLDPENFKLGNVTIEGTFGLENWPVVVGEHPIKRLLQRTFMSEDELLGKAISVLAIPLIGTEIIKHQIFWDDDLQSATDFNGDGILATAVKLESENLVLVFEAGGSYIRLVTLWAGQVSAFKTRNCATILINKYGVISYLDQN